MAYVYIKSNIETQNFKYYVAIINRGLFLRDVELAMHS